MALSAIIVNVSVFLVECTILFFHMFIAFTALSNKERLLWIVSYCVLQCTISYLLSIQLKITFAFTIVEILTNIFWTLIPSKQVIQDHFVILFAEINVYIWIICGSDALVSICIAIACQILMATSNAKLNLFQMRIIITYFLTQVLSRLFIPIMHSWTFRLFAIYAFVPLGIALGISFANASGCQSLHIGYMRTYVDIIWCIYVLFHIAFWICCFFL